ncbi:MAG: hypothetical protein HOP12_16340 [Candidatus Eisenbacteria bacterium]|uniref:histidine kinase n=1 Tax=Eiseniibacteriota bacterium TaxID=2212470 RepID=A0A849SMP6_UNCEI|nr:hypothetical protein [Candidatus Eisenbacteria bacterium]
MSIRLRLYVSSVVLLSLVLFALTAPPAMVTHWVHYLVWTGVCVVAEMLWMSTPSGKATISMASAANLAVLTLWGVWPAMFAVGVSTLIANVVLQRRPWVRALFNFGQTVIMTWSAAQVMQLLGHPHDGLAGGGRMTLAEWDAIHLMLVMLAGYVMYLALNRALVSMAVAWSTDRPFLKVLREDWIHREHLMNDAALFFSGPLAVIAYGSVGYVGLVLFWAPLQMTYETYKRFVDLQKAQDQMVRSERMAAKGEMAAEIGHELRNQLAAISGRAQILLRDAQRSTYENVERNAQIIVDQSKRMKVMADGLYQFSHAELKLESVDLNALLQNSIELVRAQNRFDGVEWETRFAQPGPTLRMDPGQIQQVLLNLMMNAADAMRENGVARRCITVRSEIDERDRTVRVSVADSGPGIPPHVMGKLFEPHFTTKEDGNGFGLSVSYRIVSNHGGRIQPSNLPDRGACFTLTLPLEGLSGWAGAA